MKRGVVARRALFLVALLLGGAGCPEPVAQLPSSVNAPPPAATSDAAAPSPSPLVDASASSLKIPTDAAAADVVPPLCVGADVDLMAAVKDPTCATAARGARTLDEYDAALELRATASPGPYKAGDTIHVTIELRNKTRERLPLVFMTTEFGDRDPGAAAALRIRDTLGVPADAPPSEPPAGCATAEGSATSPNVRIAIEPGGRARAEVSVVTIKHKWDKKRVGAEEVCTIVAAGPLVRGAYTLEPAIALTAKDGQWPRANPTAGSPTPPPKLPELPITLR